MIYKNGYEDVDISLLPDSKAEEDWKLKYPQYFAIKNQLQRNSFVFVRYTKEKKAYCKMQEKVALSELKKMAAKPLRNFRKVTKSARLRLAVLLLGQFSS
jgi:hypothetical protein